MTYGIEKKKGMATGRKESGQPRAGLMERRRAAKKRRGELRRFSAGVRRTAEAHIISAPGDGGDGA